MSTAIQATAPSSRIRNIPTDWQVDQLQEFWSVFDCKHVTARFVHDGFPVISIGEVQSKFVEVENASRTTTEYFSLLTQGARKPMPGDLIMSRNATVGEVSQVAAWHPPMAMGQDVCLLRKKSADYSTDYLQEVLKSNLVRRQLEDLMVGSTFRRVNIRQIKSLLIAMPKSAEQRAIAAVLSDMDGLIGTLDHLVAKKCAIKLAILQQLFTGRTRMTGCTEEWKYRTLRDVCRSISDGTHFTPHYVDVGIPFYSVENVTANNFSNTKFITPQEHAQLIRRCKPEKGDILLTRIGELGATRLLDWDVTASIYVSLALLKVKPDVDPRYLYCYTKTKQFVDDLEARALLNASPKKINMGEIASIPVPVPPFSKQRVIASALCDMDAEITALERRREKTRAIKQGMMQALLSGRVRLAKVEADT